jgi:hypothetical protein
MHYTYFVNMQEENNNHWGKSEGNKKNRFLILKR